MTIPEEKLKQIKEIEEHSRITNEDIAQLIELDRFAEKYKIPELREKVSKIITNLEEVIPARNIELKEGKIKELNKSIAIRKGRANTIELIIMREINSTWHLQK